MSVSSSLKTHHKLKAKHKGGQAKSPSYGSNFLTFTIVKSWQTREGVRMKRSKRLAEKRGDSKKRGKSSEALSTRFVEAAAEGDVRQVEWLLEDKRVDPWFSTTGESTALREAARMGHGDVVMLLLDDGRYNHDDDELVFLLAAQHGHTAVAKRLLEEARVDPSVQNNHAVRLAAETGHTAIVALLLEDLRVDPVDDSICLASRNGHEGVVKLLLQDSRVDPSVLNNAALCLAAHNGRTAVVKLLLQDGRANPAARDNAAICAAAHYGHSSVVKLLLEDSRVDAKRAIAVAHRCVVSLLVEDSRVGIHVNRGLFEQHQAWAVEEYDAFCAKKEALAFASMWCMKQIGNGWGDLRYPVGDIMCEYKQKWSYHGPRTMQTSRKVVGKRR